MDNFTLAVVIGMGVVLLIFLGMVVVDKGAPERRETSKPRRKRSA